MKLAIISSVVIAAASIATGVSLAKYNNSKMGQAPESGQVFIMNRSHYSLYTYGLDTPGKSNCYDACAEMWPPTIVPAGTKIPASYSLIERRDGTLQLAYKGQPLYRYSGDKEIGDISGDGIDGVWRLAKPG